MLVGGLIQPTVQSELISSVNVTNSASRINNLPPNFKFTPYYYELVRVCSSNTNAKITIAPQSTPESPDILSKEKQFLFFADKWFNQT